MKNKSPFSCKSLIIMDFDGTIANTSTIHTEAFRQALKSYSIDFQYEKYAAWRTIDVVQDVFMRTNKKISKKEIKEIINAKQEYARQGYQRNLTFIPGAESFINKALSQGFRLSLATGASASGVSVALDALGLKEKFEIVVTANDIKKGKPDPEIYLKSLSLTRVFPHEAIVIEDAFSGVLAAARANIDVICIDNKCDLRHNKLTKKAFKMTFFEMEEQLSNNRGPSNYLSIRNYPGTGHNLR